MFKVVPDQLRISEGWVRCGKCEEIFDASVHMQEAVGQEGGAGTVAGDDNAPLEGALATTMSSEAGAPESSPSSPAIVDPVIGDLDLKEPLGDTLLEPGVPSASSLPDGSAYGVAGRAEPRFSAEAEPLQATGAAGRLPGAGLSFMRAATKTTRWHRPLVRATLLVACLLLGLGLALQILVHERDYVATVEPGLKPLIEEACLLLDCQIEPFRQIESVVIDSSAFSKIKGDLYRLSLTLKNTAHFDLAMPAVELALTDTLDHALLRRVFQPEELGVKSGVIPAASETQTTLVLTIKTNGAGERVAGYRLLAFYP